MTPCSPMPAQSRYLIPVRYWQFQLFFRITLLILISLVSNRAMQLGCTSSESGMAPGFSQQKAPLKVLAHSCFFIPVSTTASLTAELREAKDLLRVSRQVAVPRHHKAQEKLTAKRWTWLSVSKSEEEADLCLARNQTAQGKRNNRHRKEAAGLLT